MTLPSLAVPYYWDTNGVTPGSGSASNTWASGSLFWNTDPTGVAGTVAVTTANTDDLFFSAGTNGTAGTVNMSGTQIAHSLTFDDSVNLTVSGGTSITLGSGVAGSGIFFAAPTGLNTISSAIALAGAATLSNSGSGTQVITGLISGSQPVTVNSSGSGAIALAGANTFTGGLTLTAGTLAVNNAAALGAAAGTLTLNGGNLDSTGTGTITVSGNNLQAWNSDFAFGGTRNLNLGTGAVTLPANRAVTVNANTAMAARSGNTNLLTVGGVVGGGAFSLTKNGLGTLSLTNIANAFTGGLIINGGAVRVAGTAGTLTANAITLSGGVIDFAGAPAASYTLGAAPGQINFVRDGGFSASSGARMIVLNTGAGLIWNNTPNFVTTGNALKFGSLNADNVLTLSNAIDLNAATRTVDVTRGTFVNVTDAILSGAVTNGSLTKTGNGSLFLSNALTALSGTTTISGGTLIFANQAAAIANTDIVLNGGALGLPTGDFTDSLATGVGKVRFAGGTADGGFSAYNTTRTVNIGGAGATLTWNATPNFLQSGALILGSSSASNTTILANGLDLNGADRTIQVEDGNGGDDARIDGIISGAASLIKTGGGVSGGGRLLLQGANTYSGSTTLRQGELVVSNSVLSGVAGPLGQSTGAIIIGDNFTLSGNDNNSTPLVFRVRAPGTVAGDSQLTTIDRPIDFSQSPNAAFVNNQSPGFTLGRYRLSLDGNGTNGVETSQLNVTGTVTLGGTNGRPVEFAVERKGQVLNITGNITGTSGQLYLTGSVNGALNTDGRTNGTFRFSNVARPFSSSTSLTYGTLIIEGSVGAAGTASPIGTQIPSLSDGNGGNTLSSAGRDATRAIFLETPGASFARQLNPGGGSSVTPAAGAQQTAYGTGGVNLMNGHFFGGTNTSGTVTFSSPIASNTVPVSATGTAGGSGGTNPVTIVHNYALIAATGGTVNFAGAFSGATLPTLGATGTPGASNGLGNNTRLTINQARNHPNLDENFDGLADVGLADALLGTATSGTVILSAANTYGSTTEVLGGTLLVNGSITGSTVTVAAGTTLGGIGSIAAGATGSTVQVNGTLAPGMSPGILTSFKPVSFNVGSTFATEINGTTAGAQYDQLLANSTVTIAATTVFSLTLGYVPAPGDQYTLINLAPGFIGGTFAGLPEGGTQTAIFGGTPYTFTASYIGGTGNDFVLTAAVPEASGTVLVISALGLLTLRRRR